MKQRKTGLILMKAILLTGIFCALKTAQSTEGAMLQMPLTYDGKTTQYAAEEIVLSVNGERLTLTQMPPVILNGRTYVPSREVFEPMGAVIDWKDNTKEVYIGLNGTLIIMKADSDKADVNGETKTLDAPAKVINDKLMIPARFVAESLGIPVGWDDKTRIVAIGEAIAEADVSANVPPSQAPQIPPPSVADTTATSGTSDTTQAVAQGAISTDISVAPLTEIQGGAVNITQLTQSGASFTVSSSGAMTKVQKLLLPENKLVLDIYNASNALPEGNITSDFIGVSSVRHSQFQEVPIKITRIVFDLAGANRYDVSLSQDRKSVNVTFDENAVQTSITGIEHISSQNGEIIRITGSQPILAKDITSSPVFSQRKLAFDIMAAKLTAGLYEREITSAFANKIIASQENASTVRITLDLTADTSYTIYNEGTALIIALVAPTYKNIYYENTPASVISLQAAEMAAIEPSGVLHTDNYLNGKYTLTLPGDMSQTLGYGVFAINDSIIDSLEIQTINGQTHITINQKTILAYKLEKTEQALVIKPVNPKEVYKNVVYLDAGHGSKDPGAQGGGYLEKNLNLNILLRLYELLENDPDIKAYATRLDDSYPTNIDRAKMANQMADAFISIHHNASESSKPNGTEVLYLNHEGEVYPSMSSEGIARIIQMNLSRAIDTMDRGVIKRTNLIVLNQTTVPAVIVEVAFMSNASDLGKIAKPEVRQAAADSLYKSIREMFEQYPTGR